MTVTDAQIENAAAELVHKWLFPTDDTSEPDDHQTAQAFILKGMLQRRMRAVATQGLNPLGMEISDLLVDVEPENICVEDGFF